MLELPAVGVRALLVGMQRVLREEVSEGIVAEEVGDLTEVEQLLEDVLAEEAGDDAHRGRQGCSADSFALDLVLVLVRGDHERRGAREAGGLSRHKLLDVATHGVLGDATLEPDLVELVASEIDAHARCVVVHTRENQIHSLALQTTLEYP